MDERNQIGVLTQFILARVFPETSPIEFGEHVVQHPHTHPPTRFNDGSGNTWPDGSRRQFTARSDHRGPHDAATADGVLTQGATCL